MDTAPRRLVDAHLHLQDADLAPHLPAVFHRAREAGVRCMVCNGTREDDWSAVAELAAANGDVVPCFGLHPWHVPHRSDRWLANLERLLAGTRSGVGEIGLDRWAEPRDEPGQEAVFRAQLALARRLRRPVMIHCLRAWSWLMDVLSDEPPLPAGMLIHAYGGPAELVEPLARRGAYFSFAGNVLAPRRAKARAALAVVPAERLLLETDAPDLLPPEPYRPHVVAGRGGTPRNEPANLASILLGVAELRGRDEEALAEDLWHNARRLLGPLME